MKVKQYFPLKDSLPPNPAPLVAVVERKVRFEEVDAMSYLWHGRYPSYFEDARLAVLEAYGIGYTAFYESGFLYPLVSLQMDYHAPLKFNQLCYIEAKMIYTGVSKINIEYKITDSTGRITTTGASVQLVIDQAGLFCPLTPDFLQHFYDSWVAGSLNS